jgi:S-adenosylmethionine decarboxylase
MDHYLNSIQDFIKPEILNNYKYRTDLNIGRENIWQTKLMVKDFGPERYVMHKKDSHHVDIENKMKLLHQEMREVFHLN